MYGTDKDRNAGVELGALGLGLLEDLIVATYVVAALWLVDFILSLTLDASSDSMTLQTFIKWKRQRVVRRVVTFLTSWLLFLAATAPFVADILLVRLRSMRFTFEIISMAIADSAMVGSVAISRSELNQAYVTGTVLVLATTFFAVVRTWTPWADLTQWGPTEASLLVMKKTCACCRSKKVDDELWTPQEDPEPDASSNGSYDHVNESLVEIGKPLQYTQTVTPKRRSCSAPMYQTSPSSRISTSTDQSAHVSKLSRVAFWLQSVDLLRLCVRSGIALLAFVALPVSILAISQASSSRGQRGHGLDYQRAVPASAEADGGWLRADRRGRHHRARLRVHPPDRELHAL
jgi:hypothetical protein